MSANSLVLCCTVVPGSCICMAQGTSLSLSLHLTVCHVSLLRLETSACHPCPADAYTTLTRIDGARDRLWKYPINMLSVCGGMGLGRGTCGEGVSVGVSVWVSVSPQNRAKEVLSDKKFAPQTCSCWLFHVGLIWNA